eukprot:CAMPEP_0170144050 /NCGR_PEP_ID=MMETSP0033_2-20121228/13274_1 /TAXON_ID=195969 /ORGANISM="Dolichomastix tenuilepis, Strain CCMP3274" /LENGTH=687 /DNA_ID=CAMNT_0010380531 /DNA_START=15 /DNA_END=2078 /DNA_ORIENTATION=-
MGKHKKSKHKKKRARREDPSSDSSSSDESSDSEQHRRRKAEKLARKLSKRMKEKSIAGYTNEENPFGDANLTEQFVWNKKIEKQLLAGTDLREFSSKAERKRHDERMHEITKVKERREQREQERMAIEEEKELLDRERAAAEAVELERKEEEFHLEQAKVRAEMRMREGRAKPIDILARNLHDKTAFDASVRPDVIFGTLGSKMIEELRADICVYVELDSHAPLHSEFWRSMLIICESEYEAARRLEDEDRAKMRRRYGTENSAGVHEAGMHNSIDKDVQQMFQNKRYSELCRLGEEIETHMRSDQATESEYWEAVLRRLEIWKAKARVREIHEDLATAFQQRQDSAAASDMRTAMGWDREQETLDGGNAAAALGSGVAVADGGAAQLETVANPPPPPTATTTTTTMMEHSDDEDAELTLPPLPEERGPLSPAWFSLEQIRADAEMSKLVIVDPLEELQQLRAARMIVRAHEMGKFNGASASGGALAGEDLFRRIKEDSVNPATATHGILGNITHRETPDELDDRSAQQRALAAQLASSVGGSGDAEFSGGEVELDSQVYWWHDKYRPRRPKYFNRVHTGYDWNRYNSAHYDHDNPPPKVVQGYKFNIFYPELIDKSKAPTYTIIPDGSKHGETCIIRFSAGPPYEDVAFRVVNKPWEHSHKRGFKCSFERGIMILHVNFQRPRYRR